MTYILDKVFLDEIESLVDAAIYDHNGFATESIMEKIREYGEKKFDDGLDQAHYDSYYSGDEA